MREREEPKNPLASVETRGDQVATLRNTRAAADPRRVVGALIVLCAASLAVASTALFVAGAHRNSQVTALKARGLRVEEQVSGCTGLLGGSGSNAAGYSCRGTIVLDGRRYQEPVPGGNLYPPGTRITVVVDPSDPGLVSSVSAVATETATWTVFVLPSLLLLSLFVLLGGVRLRTRRQS